MNASRSSTGSQSSKAALPQINGRIRRLFSEKRFSVRIKLSPEVYWVPVPGI